MTEPRVQDNKRPYHNSPWLIIPVEVQHREFLARLLLGAVAVKRGVRVLFGRDTAIRRAVPFLPRGVVFDKDLGSVRHGKMKRFRRYGYRFCAQDEEATGYYGSPERFLSVRMADETLALADRFMCISDAFVQGAGDMYPASKDKLVTTGMLRTDIWRPAFHRLYASEVDAIRSKHGRYILFCSNFGLIIHARGQAFVEKQIRGQAQQFPSIIEQTKKIFDEGKPNLEAFIEMLPQLREWFPDHKIIVRPHPSESRDFWQEKLAGISRLEIIYEGTATPWILGSDCLVHHGCTTGIEAEIMEKPQVMYAPFPDEHHDTEIMETFAPIEHDLAGLESTMKALVAGKRVRKRPIEAMETWFAGLSGRLVADRIMDEIEPSLFPGQDVSSWIGLANYSPRALVAAMLPRSTRERAYSSQKWQGTSVAEIEQKLAEIAGVIELDGSQTFKARCVLPEIFELSLR